MTFPVSTNSTTSKSSTFGGMYGDGSYYPSNSTSTSGNLYHPTMQPYGYNTSGISYDKSMNGKFFRFLLSSQLLTASRTRR